MVASYSCALLLAATSAGQLPRSGETVLLNFSSPWCEPCRQMQPVLHQLEATGYPVRSIDVTRDDRLAARYQITRTPTYVLLVEGREVDRAVGATSLRRLKEMLHRAQVRPPGESRGDPRGQSPDDIPVNRGRGQPLNLSAEDRNPFDRGAAPGPATTPAAGGLAEANSTDARLINGSVRIKVEDAHGYSHGTGTIIYADHRTALILTCGHLFREARTQDAIEVDLFQSTRDGVRRVATLPAEVVQFDLKREIGLLRIQPPFPVQAVQVAPRGARLEPGDRCASVGCDYGGDPSLWPSRLVSINRYNGPANIEASRTPVQGRSGGGLFNDRGELIGVCYAADDRANEGLYASLPSIYGELERAGLAAVINTAPRGLVTQQNGGVPGLPAAERATLEEIARRAEGAEVICIIRPNRAGARSEIITIENASERLLSVLWRVGERAARPRLTAHPASTQPEVALQPLRKSDRREIVWSSKR